MQTILQIFKSLSQYPRCSGDTVLAREYLTRFCEKIGYRVEVDTAGNVAAYFGGEPKVTLQAHYDMVCIGRAPHMQIEEKEGWLRAKESSLGADNGIGAAMMLYLAQKGAPVDLLFTNDEEIGLLGAQDLALAIRTDALINLDTEEAGRVYIGCAGGEDIFAEVAWPDRKKVENGRWLKLTARAPGGHSGVNIAEEIPNAIIELADAIYRNRAVEVASFTGGERINAIPRRAEAVVWVPNGADLTLPEGILAQPAQPRETVAVKGRCFVGALAGFAHGVRAWNSRLDLPQSSINLATAEMDGALMRVALSARSMSNKALEALVERTVAGWEVLGFACRREGKYPAWDPVETPLAKKALALYQKHYPDADMTAIHAGLECALFAKRYPHMQIVSLGPTILDPHSDRERLEIASIEPVLQTVEALISAL